MVAAYTNKKWIQKERRKRRNEDQRTNIIQKLESNVKSDAENFSLDFFDGILLLVSEGDDIIP